MIGLQRSVTTGSVKKMNAWCLMNTLKAGLLTEASRDFLKNTSANYSTTHFFLEAFLGSV